MRLTRVLLLVVLLGCVVPGAYGQKTGAEEWLPITQQDLQARNVPGNTNASAIQLYFSYYQNDNESFIAVYKRIKILNDAGKKYADIEIEIAPKRSLRNVAARTVHPDGTIIEFKDKPLEQTRSKTRGVKYTAKVFTLPDVTVGSIIEVRWIINLPPRLVRTISEWPVQGELFTLKEVLRFRPYQGLVQVPTEWANLNQKSQVSYSYLNQVDATLPQKNSENVVSLELQNVPVFFAEDYMPPKDNYRPIVLFYYGGRETASPDRFWDEWQRIGTEYMEKYIGNFREVREMADQAVAGESDPDKKLRKLYARAQQIRNLSAERTRTEDEAKKEDLKPNKSVADVVKHGYGRSRDINRLFAAMARAEGFDATILEVSNRQDRNFNRLMLWLGQVDDEAVLVKSGGKDLVLDPGTRFCPYGSLRWGNSAATALHFGKSVDTFMDTPAPEISRMHRAARMTLNADGSLRGEVTVEWNGAEALEKRLEGLDTDEAGRRKSLEDEVTSWLPPEAKVKMVDTQGWQASDVALSARFTLEVPTYASMAGKRMVVPAVLFSPFKTVAFNSPYRRYPIAFSYPFSEDDEVNIIIPEGYAVEEPAYRRKAALAYASYEFSGGVQGKEMSLKRNFVMQRAYFEPEKYNEMKGFFSIVQAGDEGQALLRSDGGPTEKSK